MAMDYITEHLDQAITLEDVAKASHFSPFHFHRIFHSLVGETVNDYVSRKKMENAASTLICHPHRSVTEVAMMGGFSSTANFSKAFKLYFGISPSQLRKPHASHDSKIGKIYSKYGKAFNSKDLYSQFVTDSMIFDPHKLEEMLMNVLVKEINEKHIAFLTAPCGYELNAIFATWDRIIHWAKTTGIDDQQKKRYAICHDNPMITPTDKCRYDACIEIDNETEVAAPCTKSLIPSGKYAVAYYKGASEKVSNFYTELYAAWLPNSGYEPDNFPPVAHYLNDSREDGFVEMDVYIKLKDLTNI
jgi:AraC family transcriptional regulator